MKKIWVLIGSYEDHEYGYGGYTGRSEWIDENIATFDTEQMALSYIKKSKLKNTNEYSKRQFRKSSLLSRFRYASVEEYSPEQLVHNPII